MQDPKDLKRVFCDRCERLIGPKEKCLRMPTHTLWSGAVGSGVWLCSRCSREVFGIKTTVLV